MLAVFSVMGFSFSGAAPNQGLMFARLKPFEERIGDEHSVQAVLGRISGPLFGIPVSVIIGRDGVIAKKHSGIATKEQIEREIKILL